MNLAPILVLLFSGAGFATPEAVDKNVQLKNGEEYTIEGFTSYHRLFTKLDNYSIHKLKDSFPFIFEITGKNTSSFLSSLTNERFDIFLLLYALTNKDAVFANLLSQLGSKSHSYSSESLKSWIQSNVQFNASEFYEVVKYISKEKGNGLVFLPKYFIEQIIFMNDKYKAFETACSNGEEEVVEWFLKSGIDLRTVSYDVLSDVWVAHQMNVLKLLLENNFLNVRDLDGVDLNKTVDSKTLLHITAELGLIETSKRLVAAGADVNAVDSRGWTPLFSAVKYNNLNMLKVLVGLGGDVFLTSSENGDSLLHVATSINNVDAVGELLRLGVPVNRPNVHGITPMYSAVMNGNVMILYVLTFSGGDLSFTTISGDTLVHIACSLGNLNILKALVTLGAEIHKENDLGETSLFVSAKKGDTNTMKFLVSKGENLNSKDRKGMSLLHRSAKFGELIAASALIKSGMDVNTKGMQGVTPLYVAVDEGNAAMSKFLLSNGADPNVSSDGGWTPLHRAALWGFEDIATLLLKYRANPNTTTTGGWTPSSLAQKYCHARLYKIIQSVVDPDFVDFDVRLTVRTDCSGVLGSNDLEYTPR